MAGKNEAFGYFGEGGGMPVSGCMACGRHPRIFDYCAVGNKGSCKGESEAPSEMHGSQVGGGDHGLPKLVFVYAWRSACTRGARAQSKNLEKHAVQRIQSYGSNGVR